MEPAILNPADTAWILISSAFVMLMTPGLAFFTVVLLIERVS